MFPQVPAFSVNVGSPPPQTEAADLATKVLVAAGGAILAALILRRIVPPSR